MTKISYFRGLETASSMDCSHQTKFEKKLRLAAKEHFMESLLLLDERICSEYKISWLLSSFRYSEEMGLLHHFNL